MVARLLLHLVALASAASEFDADHAMNVVGEQTPGAEVRTAKGILRLREQRAKGDGATATATTEPVSYSGTQICKLGPESDLYVAIPGGLMALADKAPGIAFEGNNTNETTAAATATPTESFRELRVHRNARRVNQKLSEDPAATTTPAAAAATEAAAAGTAAPAAGATGSMNATQAWEAMVAVANQQQTSGANGSVRVFNFGFGSVFNEEAQRVAMLKRLLTNDSCNTTSNALTPHGLKAYRESVPDASVLVNLTGPFQRRLMNPSGPPNWVWTASLHQTPGQTFNTFGALTVSSRQQFIDMYRSNVQEFDVMQISPDNIKSEDGKPIREELKSLGLVGDADKIVVYAYGFVDGEESNYKTLWHSGTKAENPGISKVHARGIPVMQTGDGQADQPYLEAVCETTAYPANCKHSVQRGRRHVLAQSYLDEILSGIMQFGWRTTVASVDGKQVQVCGGVHSFKAKTTQRMKAWIETTLFPTHLLDYQSPATTGNPKVWYVNDRLCPRAPNPIWVDSNIYGIHQGVASSGTNTTAVFELIDEVLGDAVKVDVGGSDFKVTSQGVRQKWEDDRCTSVAKEAPVYHFTDKLDGYTSLWDRAHDISQILQTAEATFMSVQKLVFEVDASVNSTKGPTGVDPKGVVAEHVANGGELPSATRDATATATAAAAAASSAASAASEAAPTATGG